LSTFFARDPWAHLPPARELALAFRLDWIMTNFTEQVSPGRAGLVVKLIPGCYSRAPYFDGPNSIICLFGYRIATRDQARSKL